MIRVALAFAFAGTLSGCRPSTAAGIRSGMDARPTAAADAAAGKVAAAALIASSRNLLPECVRFEIGSVRTERNVALAAAKLRITRSIASCGCKSALISYRSVQRVRGRDVELARGQINTLKLDQSEVDIYIVLATDTLSRAPELTVVLGCENPE